MVIGWCLETPDSILFVVFVLVTLEMHPSVVKFGVSISGLAIAAVTASFQMPLKHLSPRNGDWLVIGNTRLYTVRGVCLSDTRCLGPTDGCTCLVF